MWKILDHKFDTQEGEAVTDKKTQETYQPSAMCGPCLEADFNNPMSKRTLMRKLGSLITD